MVWDGTATATRVTSQVAVNVRQNDTRCEDSVQVQHQPGKLAGRHWTNYSPSTLSISYSILCWRRELCSHLLQHKPLWVPKKKGQSYLTGKENKNIILPYLEIGNEGFHTGFVLQSCLGRSWLGSGQNEAQFQQELHLLLWSATEPNTGIFWHLESKYLAPFNPMC